MANFTFSDFKDLTENENSLNKLLHPGAKQKEPIEPSKTSIDNILAYSKAISVRKSEQVGFIENLLN